MNEKQQAGLLEIAIKAAIAAAEVVMGVYNLSDFKIQLKSDASPLTIADKKSHQVIMEQLTKTGFPVLSAEGIHVDYEERHKWEYLWAIDPLDGTKEFISKNGESTINIALIHDRLPIIGVVYVPEKKILYYTSLHIGSYKIVIDSIDNIL